VKTGATSRGVGTKIKMANEDEDVSSGGLVELIGLYIGWSQVWLRPKSKTKVLDFGLSPAQKFWSWTEFSLMLVLDECLRLWSKPKVLDCRVQNYCYRTGFAATIGNPYKGKWWRCRTWKGGRYTDKNGAKVYVSHVS